MATQLSVINKAIRFLGEDQLASLEQLNKLSLSAGAAWDDALEWCLRCHPWSFAQKWETLAKLTETPAFAYCCAYMMPSDCLRLVDIRQHADLRVMGAPFSVVGRKVYTDIDPCYARYVYRCTDPTFWPADFTEVVSYKIALDVASVIVPGDSPMRKDLDSRFFISLDMARKNDLCEDNPPELDRHRMSPTLQARYGKGVGHGWD